MSNKTTKHLMIRVGHYGYLVTIHMLGKPTAVFTDDTPALELPENWTRDMIRKHIEKYAK